VEKIWNSLEPQIVKNSISPPILGYHGTSLTDNINQEWFVYDGHITLKVNGKSDSRLDRNETEKYEHLFQIRINRNILDWSMRKRFELTLKQATI